MFQEPFFYLSAFELLESGNKEEKFPPKNSVQDGIFIWNKLI